MDETRVKMAREDVVYQSDERDLAQLEGKYIVPELSEETRRIIDDYFACLQTSDSRYADIFYMAGIEDYYHKSEQRCRLLVYRRVYFEKVGRVM